MLLRSKKIGRWVAVVCILTQACSKEAPQKQFIARVDQALLTNEELADVVDSLSSSPQHTREYINEWVNTELLFQEATRRGLGDNNHIRRRIEATSKKLIAGVLLEQELYRDESVSEDEIVTMYRGGGDAFRLREDVVRASYALFRDRDAANMFRDKLVRGTAWNAAVEETQRDSLLRSRLVRVATRQFFTQSNLYPVELWKLARTLGKDEVSFVVKTDAGNYVLIPHSVTKQGELPELEYARNEIRDRILIEQRRIRYEQLLARLRSNHAVEVRLPDRDSLHQTIE